MSTEKKAAQLVTGTIVSHKMDKTIVVRVDRKVRHPLLGKVIRRSVKLHAHDEANQGKVGDMVTISETRPYSKTKTWVLVEIVGQAAI